MGVSSFVSPLVFTSYCHDSVPWFIKINHASGGKAEWEDLHHEEKKNQLRPGLSGTERLREWPVAFASHLSKRLTRQFAYWAHCLHFTRR